MPPIAIPRSTQTHDGAAIVDLLTFRGTIIETGIESYRLAHTR